MREPIEELQDASASRRSLTLRYGSERVNKMRPGYLSRSVNFTMEMEETDIESKLKNVASYKRSLSDRDPNRSFTKALKLRTRYCFRYKERFYRGTKGFVLFQK